MARQIERLKAISLNRLTKPGRYADGAGLWLQVSRWGTRSWLFQYTSPSTGKVRQLGLGALHTLKLADAREHARRAREQVKQGIDPIDARRDGRKVAVIEAARRVTFKQAAERFIDDRRDTWANKVHANQWQSTLETYAFPAIGELFVADIEKQHVLSILEPIWKTKTETASRLRARIENILDFAIAHGWREGQNPAAWKGQLREILPPPKKLKRVKHHAALPYRDIGQFMKKLRDRDGIAPRALEFTILTAARTNETIAAQWDEIHFTDKVWSIPADRMKAKRKHTVPLSDDALKLLKSLPREKDNPYIFLGAKAGTHLSNMAMLKLVKGLRSDLTTHGFRSTFRDWAAEETAFPNFVVEMALAHVIGDRTEAAYRRGDLLAKRRQLMAAWAKKCSAESPSSKAGSNVTSIRAAGRPS